MAISNNNKGFWDELNSHQWMADIINDKVSTGVLPQSFPITNNGSISNVTASTIMSNRLSDYQLAQMNLDEMNHLMKGEMVTANYAIPDSHKATMVNDMTVAGFKEEVKRKLCSIMVEHMMKNNLIEFTQTEDVQDLQTVYRARAYIMPDHMTKILREYIQRNT